MIRKSLPILLIFNLFLFSATTRALDDQGLSSVMSIIDRAIDEYTALQTDQSNEDPQAAASTEQSATGTIVNLSRTLGKLSYSRLQCGQAEVLAEFTQRVQKMPEDFRDPMRDAFQEGFDQGKDEAPLLSEDECARLTQSRTRGDKEVESKVKEDNSKKAQAKQEQVDQQPVIEEDPKLRHLRIAELSGQLAYRRKYCGDEKRITRDFNELIGAMPEAVRAEAQTAYWKGYRHGKRINKGLTRSACN